MVIQKKFFRKAIRPFAAAGITAIWLAGCAMQGHPPAPESWQCDIRADAAVEAGDWQQARLAHEQLLTHEPSNCLALFHLGFIWGSLGERRKEIQFYKQSEACGYTTDDRLYFNLGMALAATGDLEAAGQAMQKAVDLRPGHADNFFGLGLITREAGFMEQALDAYQAAVRLNPDHWEAHEELVRLYLDLGRWQAAQNQLIILEKGNLDRSVVQELWDTLQRRRTGENRPGNTQLEAE